MTDINEAGIAEAAERISSSLCVPVWRAKVVARAAIMAYLAAAKAGERADGASDLHNDLRALAAKWVSDAASGDLIRGPRNCANELEHLLSAPPTTGEQK